MTKLSAVGVPDRLATKLRYRLLVTGWRLVSVLRPWRSKALFHLGNAHFAHGRRADALRCWQAAMASGNPPGQALHNLANALLEDGQWAEAARTFRRLTQLRPDAAYPYLAGKCHFAMQEREAARQDFELCLEREPQHVGALEHLGRMALAQRDGAAAHALLSRALTKAENRDAIHFLLGTACELMREPAKALAHYHEISAEPLLAEASKRITRLSRSRTVAVPGLSASSSGPDGTQQIKALREHSGSGEETTHSRQEDDHGR